MDYGAVDRLAHLPNTKLLQIREDQVDLEKNHFYLPLLSCPISRVLNNSTLKEDEVVYASSVTHLPSQDMRRVGVFAKPTFLWAEREARNKNKGNSRAT